MSPGVRRHPRWRALPDRNLRGRSGQREQRGRTAGFPESTEERTAGAGAREARRFPAR